MVNSERYSRQTVLDNIGEGGQKKLSMSRVTVVGLGALGSVIVTLLGRAGVGHLRLIDRDIVELVNLHRQILYEEADVGMPKALRAVDKIRKINSDIEVEGVAKDMNYANAIDLLDGSQLIMDGTDNLETRFLINEACLELDVPWIYGGAIGVEGRVMTIVPGKTACFQCFTRNIPAPGALPTCEITGILNSVASATASFQVTEAIKLLLGEKTTGDLFVLDGWSPELIRMKIKRREDCPACIKKEKEFLGGKKPQAIAALCGQNTISFDPLRKGDIDLPVLSERLSKVGKVRTSEPVILFEVDKYELTIFKDGRALIKGTNSEEVAKTLYSKYIGL